MSNLTSNYYFDTNALFKYYKSEAGTLNIRRFVSNSSKPVLVSSLTLLECFGVMMEYYRKRQLKKKDVNDLYKRLEKDVAKNWETTRPFQRIKMPEGSFRLAKDILFQQGYTFRVEATDALHLAIAKKLSELSPVIMVTSDHAMQHVCKHLSISVYDPEMD